MSNDENISIPTSLRKPQSSTALGASELGAQSQGGIRYPKSPQGNYVVHGPIELHGHPGTDPFGAQNLKN